MDRKSGLVVQWDFYDDASDEEPALSTPWKNWQRYGDILLSDDRGRGRLTGISVLDVPPAGAFDDPAPVALPRGSE